MFSLCFGGSTSTVSINEDIEGDPIYLNNQLCRMQEGLSIIIRGRTYAKGERFIVDFSLQNSTKDIALRIAVVLNRNIVGRNSRLKGYWGTEETSSVIPFVLTAGEFFQLQILFTLEAILIAIDGFHVAKYPHRLPFHDIRQLEIRGDVQRDVYVERKIVTDYPQRTEKSKHFVSLSQSHAATGIYDPQDYADFDDELESDGAEDPLRECERYLPLPYYASFPKGFFDLGYSLVVVGRVRTKPQSFTISLQAGPNIWPQPTVALQLEFRFVMRSDGETGEPLILRNSFAKGRWTGEFKSELSTGLRAGADFHLLVVRGKKAFEISMNDKPITDYPYKVNPKYVDTLYVAGDIKLFNIEIEEGD